MNWSIAVLAMRNCMVHGLAVLAMIALAAMIWDPAYPGQRQMALWVLGVISASAFAAALWVGLDVRVLIGR